MALKLFVVRCFFIAFQALKDNKVSFKARFFKFTFFMFPGLFDGGHCGLRENDHRWTQAL